MSAGRLRSAALRELLGRLARRQIRLVEVETPTASPFATSLLFDYVGAFLYEGDSPLAERRAAALSLDSTLLAELLGRVELRELLDADVIDQAELELQRLVPERRARDAEGVADLLRLLGPLTDSELRERSTDDPGPWLADLSAQRRVLQVSYAGEKWWAAIEDASRLRDALGVPLPIGVPTAFVEPLADPLGDLVARHARTHGPFTTAAVGARFGLGTAVVESVLQRLADDKRVTSGEFRPGATGAEWCDSEVLRRLRRRSLAAARHEVEPVSTATLGRFLPDWHHLGRGPGASALYGLDGVAAVAEQIAGVPLPASALEPLILAPRVRDYSPAMLDELTSNGEIVWSGAARSRGRTAGSRCIPQTWPPPHSHPPTTSR